MTPSLFCSNCYTYLGATRPQCPACLQDRYVGPLPPLDEPLWQAALSGPVHGRPAAAADLVLFAWGKRGGNGGITALERAGGGLRWQVPTAHNVESELLVRGEYVYSATLSFIGQGAEVLCCRLSDGQIVWRQPLSGSAWSAPALFEQRLFVACDSGQVHCFDALAGEEIVRWSFQVEKGRLWLAQAAGSLYVLSSRGKIYRQPLNYPSKQPAALETNGAISSGAATNGQELFFGLDGGSLAAFDVRSGKVRTLVKDKGWNSMIAAPHWDRNALYAGAHDRRLHAVDIQSGREIWGGEGGKCGRSISTTPGSIEDLVVVGANDGQLRFFDKHDGKEAWAYVSSAQPILCSPLVLDSMIYFGDEAGQVFALPWHLGHYAEAAQRLVAGGKHDEAAVFYAIASDQEMRSMKRREEYEQRAMENWRQAGSWEEAAYFQAALPGAEPCQTAEAFEQAGKALSRRDPSRAVILLNRAADWYDEAGDRESAASCQRQAARVAAGPYLSLRTDGRLPDEWEAGEERVIVLDVKNLGSALARSIRLRFAGGALVCRVWVNLADLQPNQRSEVEIPLLARGPGELQIEAFYYNLQGQELSSGKRIKLNVKDTTWLDIQGDAGAVILKYGANLPGKVRVRGDAGLIKVIPETTSEPAPSSPRTSLSVPEFTWPSPGDGFKTDEVELISAFQAGDDVTIPAGYWAFFLADGRMLGRFEPGYHARKSLEALRPALLPGARRPTWEVVQFRSADVRLAFRMGPYSAQDGLPMGIEFGLTLAFQSEGAFDFWQQAAQGRQKLSAADLQGWLSPETSGVLEEWLHRHTLDQLGFAQRDRLALDIEEELRETFNRHGLRLAGRLWALKFVVPPGAKAVVTQSQQPEVSAYTVCPQCARLAQPGCNFCDSCGARLR